MLYVALCGLQDLYRVVQGIDVFDPKFNIVYGPLPPPHRAFALRGA